MQLLPSLHISMMLKDKQQRMLVLLLALMSSVLLTNLQLLLLHMELISARVSKTSSFSILVEVLLMSHYLLLIMVSSKSLQLLVILIWEVKISINALPSISLRPLRRRQAKTFLQIQDLCKNLRVR